MGRKKKNLTDEEKRNIILDLVGGASVEDAAARHNALKTAVTGLNAQLQRGSRGFVEKWGLEGLDVKPRTTVKDETPKEENVMDKKFVSAEAARQYVDAKGTPLTATPPTIVPVKRLIEGDRSLDAQVQRIAEQRDATYKLAMMHDEEKGEESLGKVDIDWVKESSSKLSPRTLMWFSYVKASGYPGGLIDFIDEAVEAYFKDRGHKLVFVRET